MICTGPEYPFLDQRTESEYAIEHERHGEDEIVGAEKPDGAFIHGVKKKTHDGKAAGNIEHVGQKFKRIAAECFAKGNAVFGKQDYLAVTFAKAKEQAKCKRADDKPRRNKNAYHHRPCNRTQDKAERNYNHIDDHQPFENKRIEARDDKIGNDDNRQIRQRA